MAGSSRRSSSLSKRQQAAQREYKSWVAAHPQADQAFRETIEELLGDAGITYDAVTSRVKALPSFLEKIDKKLPSGAWFFPAGFSDAYDLVGIRVTTFHSTEIPEIRRVLEQAFTVERIVDKTAETRIAGGFGYGSLHLICRVPAASDRDKSNLLAGELTEFAGQLIEVQIRTVLQHAWAEFEHDIRYKGPGSGNDPRVDRAFTLAAGLIELADQQFDQIAAIVDQTSSASTDADDVQLTPEILPGVLTMILGPSFPRSKSEYYRYAEAMLAANGITDVGALRDLLSEPLVASVCAAMHPDFPPGQVRMVDDALLARFGHEHIKRTVDIGDHGRTRSGRLGNRWKALLDAGLGPAKPTAKAGRAAPAPAAPTAPAKPGQQGQQGQQG